MGEVGFAIKRKCLECKLQFNADDISIGGHWMLTDICKNCREKHKQLPDILPKYLLEDIVVYVPIKQEYIPVA